jgi:hypothetical protein
LHLEKAFRDDDSVFEAVNIIRYSASHFFSSTILEVSRSFNDTIDENLSDDELNQDETPFEKILFTQDILLTFRLYLTERRFIWDKN